jgi:type I restriction enzyme R subunit
VQGFYTKDELELLIQLRTSREALGNAPINAAIVERHYQERAIRRIGEAFERDHDRKALIVMATGAGKTRTVIALADLLMRCNWAKRVLFLADRVALVRQAVNAFKAHLPDAPAINLVTEKNVDGRVLVSTYPTMMGLIEESRDGQRRFGVGHFDLIVIDEAPSSVYQKYRAIFEYFDALLVGLTATPKDEIDRNTYGLFDLETGVPTDAYDREAAKTALAGFTAGKTLRANQIEFLDLIVNHLTERGILEAERLYESPYTDFSALGVEGVFASDEVAELVAVLAEIRRRAA